MAVAASVVGAEELVSVVGAAAGSAASELLAPKRNARIAMTSTATAATAVAAAAHRQVLLLRPGEPGCPPAFALRLGGWGHLGIGGRGRVDAEAAGLGPAGLVRVGRPAPSGSEIGAGGRKPGRAPGPLGVGGTPAPDSSSMPAR